MNCSTKNTQNSSSWNPKIHFIANFFWQETCSKWSSLCELQLDSNKKGSPKALIFVHTFKCKIAADVQHGIGTTKSTKMLAPSCPGSCRFICPLPFPSVHCLVVPVRSEKRWEDVLAVSWRRRSSSSCAIRGKHLPPHCLGARCRKGSPRSVSPCDGTRLCCAVRAHLCVRGAAGVRAPCRSGGFCKLGLYRALPQAGGEASGARAGLRHTLLALFFLFFLNEFYFRITSN